MELQVDTLKQYTDKFLSANPKIYIREEHKTWYKQKFQFKVVFDTGRSMWDCYPHGSKYGVDRTFFRKFGDARFRRENGTSVYTNSTELLDYILANNEAVGNVMEFVTSSDQYVTEMQTIGNIAVDVKVVSPRTFNPLYKYEIEFKPYYDWQSLYPGRFGEARSAFVKEIVKFCKDNKKEITAHPHMVDFVKSKESTYYSYYNKMSIYPHEDDIVLQVVMMHQEKIAKIYKLVERVKK